MGDPCGKFAHKSQFFNLAQVCVAFIKGGLRLFNDIMHFLHGGGYSAKAPFIFARGKLAYFIEGFQDFLMHDNP